MREMATHTMVQCNVQFQKCTVSKFQVWTNLGVPRILGPLALFGCSQDRSNFGLTQRTPGIKADSITAEACSTNLVLLAATRPNLHGTRARTPLSCVVAEDNPCLAPNTRKHQPKSTYIQRRHDTSCYADYATTRTANPKDSNNTRPKPTPQHRPGHKNGTNPDL